MIRQMGKKKKVEQIKLMEKEFIHFFKKAFCHF